MEKVKADNVAAIVRSVAAYGGQLAAVFHNFALIAEKIPHGFEGATNILDATITTLNQVLTLLRDEVEGPKSGRAKKLFSDEGLQYVQLLAKECATSLVKVEPIIAEDCLDRKERNKIRRQQRKKAKSKNLHPEIDLTTLKLNERAFLAQVEKTRWRWASKDLGDSMDRLYDIQLYLLLVFQVVTVGALSQDLRSSGKVDIRNIVTYNNRINRTADLIGIVSQPRKNKYGFNGCRRSFSDSDILSSDSSSDTSSIISLKPKKNGPTRVSRPLGCQPGPPPPPPACIISPAAPSNEAILTKSGVIDLTTPAGSRADNANPPAYSESPKSDTTGTSTMIGTKTQTPKSSNPPSPREKSASLTAYRNEKSPVQTQGAPNKEESVGSNVPEARLFESSPNGFGFKLKTFFRSKESLAVEMKRVLSDTEAHLTAFVIQKYDFRQVPHSAFHSLEATHMRTILSQLNDNTWYNTFATLDPVEHSTLDRVIHPNPWINGKPTESRELIALKVLQQNRLNAWMALLSEVLRSRPFPSAKGRVVLAIAREKLGPNGQPMAAIVRGPPPPPPPGASPYSSIRPPPLPSPPRISRISDLRYPPPPPPPPPVGWDSRPMPLRVGPPPPAPPGPGPSPGVSPPSTSSPVSPKSEAKPLTDYDATLALTTYGEYTIRPEPPLESNGQRSWSRVSITQESAERHIVLQRVRDFQRQGGNMIIGKLRLSEEQSAQVTRLMNDLKSQETDIRFEWVLVEISLFNQAGIMTDWMAHGACNAAAGATVIHLIAKRMPKPHCKPMELYKCLMAVSPPPPPPGVRPSGPPSPPPPPGGPVVIRLDKKKPRHSNDTDTDSGSLWSDDSSIGNVRRRLRRRKARKTRVKGRSFYNDSDSDFDEDSEEEDVIKLDLELKKGDDVVKALLDLWTPEPEVKGKGKAKAL